MPSSIITSDTQTFNAFTQTRQLYSLDMLLGTDDANGTGLIDPSDNTTYRWAIRMPSIGFLHMIRCAYTSKASGANTGTFDFRLFRSPFDAPDFDFYWDRIYEQRAIRFGTIWEHSFSDRPLMFSNRQAYIGQDPDTSQDVTQPRNFLWMEARPNDATATEPEFRINLTFEV